MRIRLVLACLLLASPALAARGDCRTVGLEAADYTVCTAAAGEDLRLFLTAGDGEVIGTFERLKDLVASEGKRLGFAMNGGMYLPDRRPVGLFVADGEGAGRLVTSASRSNFGMLPNGVFCVRNDGFAVIETLDYQADPPPCRYATQSGPMLVIGGKLHPRFREDATSRFVRNGVGVSADGRTAYFAISEQPVTFHEFARLFRDELKAPNALYLDGNVSRLFAPELGREDGGFPMGPMIGLVKPAG